MELKKIFIVEDEAIVARDIELRLKAMGYEVVGIAASGEKAIELINTTSPDFVLMDIHLKGKMDGIETAEIVRKTHDIPIVFLTAFADNPTLERAKATDPFGYILKPFEERALQIHIEIAFHKYETEKRIKNREKWIESVLNSIGEAIVATDPEGIINFANPAAADLLGARQDNLIGKSALDTIIFCDEMKTPAINPLSIVLTKGTAQMSDNSQLQYDKEAFITVSFSAVPLQN
ncbi:response regulator, partial [bacterium]|nr:response regulator [bacterium]